MADLPFSLTRPGKIRMSCIALFGIAALLFLMVPASSASAMTIKEFKDGQWVECDTANPEGCNSDSPTREIHLNKWRGVYALPVKVNGVLTLNFVLDTGAAEVNIPSGVASRLLRNGTIGQEDFLPGRIYQLADGSLVKSSRVILKRTRPGRYQGQRRHCQHRTRKRISVARSKLFEPAGALVA